MTQIPDGYRSLHTLTNWSGNYNEGDVGRIYLGIKRFGYNRTVSVWKDGVVMAGNHTLLALKLAYDNHQRAPKKNPVPVNVIEQREEWYVQVSDCSHLSFEEAKAYAISDNRLAALASQDESLLFQYLQEIQESLSPDTLTATGYDLDDLELLRQTLTQEEESGDGDGDGGETDETKKKAARVALAERFVAPPFSVLDTRQSYWQKRKRVWLDLGVRSYEGRDENLTYSNIMRKEHYNLKEVLTQEWGRVPSNEEVYAEAGKRGINVMQQTSAFDPVLCELVTRWFSPDGGRVLDPFAGGTALGVVAYHFNREYWGVEIRKEQVEANIQQAAALVAGVKKATVPAPVWLQGNSADLDSVLEPGLRFDLWFSSPPYYDLEKYSDSPDDLSNAASYQ